MKLITKQKKMKSKNQNPILWMAILFCGFMISCNNGDKKSAVVHEVIMEENAVEEKATLPDFGNVVEVTSTGMNFIMPDEIPSGWTTFRYSNESPMAHFMLVDKLPVFEGEQMTYEDFEEIPPVFIAAMDLINDGKTEEGFAEFANLPEWMPEIIFSGGVGLVSPGETGQTTIFIEPGNYVVECYVKTGGKFHPMSKALTVTENPSEGNPPTPTMEMEISGETGIKMMDEPEAGLQTIAVHFKDQGPHEHFMGHDLHLVKLEKDSDLEDIGSWMNWADPEGFNTPAPVKFLGGVQEMPAGNTAYFTVDLQPGNYAWISEVPDPASKSMLKTFSVSQNNSGIGAKKD